MADASAYLFTFSIPDKQYQSPSSTVANDAFVKDLQHNAN